MKKWLALLLAVLMLASFGCAWAEGTAEELPEITFQGIPWGSSKEDVKSWAKENGFQEVGHSDDGFTEEFLDTSGKYVSGAVIIDPNHKSEAILQAWDGASFQIAGYPIYRLDFHFDVQDGKTKLNTVVVRFLPQGATTNEQAQAILDDLEQKLITVYGENDMPATDDSLSTSPNYSSSRLLIMGGNDRYRKLGAEDTAICLTKQMINNVMLVYGKTIVHVPEGTNNTLFTIDRFNIGGL